jgi:hypothetical protein
MFESSFELRIDNIILRNKNDYAVWVYLNYTVMNDLDHRALEEKI